MNTQRKWIPRQEWLRQRAAQAGTTPPPARPPVDLEAARIRRGLELFSERLIAYARTPEGQARAEYLRDKEYDELVEAYRWKQYQESYRSGIDESN